jgi:hypothetical protein
MSEVDYCPDCGGEVRHDDCCGESWRELVEATDVAVKAERERIVAMLRAVAEAHRRAAGPNPEMSTFRIRRAGSADTLDDLARDIEAGGAK